MANKPTQSAGGKAAATQSSAKEGGFLDQAIAATKATDPSQVSELLRTLTSEALSGSVVFSKNLTVTFNRSIAAIDKAISEQLAAIMHHEKFTKLEGTWRGLHYLVSNSLTNANLKIKVINTSKFELAKDLAKAIDFDQSTIFKKIYENEFGMAGGEPYGTLIGDFYFDNTPDDMELLRNMSGIAAGAFAPFIAAAGPGMFGMDSFEELAKPRDLKQKFDASDYMKWRGFRDTEDSRFVSLAMPRVLAREPYGRNTRAIEEFAYEEAPADANGNPLPMKHDDYCWMNAAYALGVRMTESFSQTGFSIAIRGAEGGGKVADLPMHSFLSDDGDADAKCPTEIGITDRREKELSDLGFLPLCHYKNTDYAVFFGGQTANRPKTFDKPEASDNAAISARLPYIMATSRFAHYLKVMARDKIGSFMEREDCQTWLNRWIQNYVNGLENASQELRARYPLREARVEVQEIAGKPGAYNAVAFLRPWLQFEELTTSMRLVARIPEKA
jgi:type VI secretion system protein ImpC